MSCDELCFDEMRTRFQGVALNSIIKIQILVDSQLLAPLPDQYHPNMPDNYSELKPIMETFPCRLTVLTEVSWSSMDWLN